MFNQNISHTQIIEYQTLICIAWKWSNEKKVHVTSISDNKSRLNKNIYDDYHVTKELRKILDSDEQFVVCGHNLKGFDIKKFNTALIRNGMNPVPDRQVIDTLKEARKHFKFESNRLDYVCRVLGIGEKMETGGQQLWTDIVQAKYPEVGKEKDIPLMEKSLSKMEKYCKQDVALLPPLYERLKPFITKHPNANAYQRNQIGCTRCGGLDYIKQGWRVLISGRKYQRYFCRSCKAPFDPPVYLRQWYEGS